MAVPYVGRVSVPDRTPVIVGVGQVLNHDSSAEEGREPADLMAEAVRHAFDDAGIPLGTGIDSIRVVSTLSWRYRNPAWAVARHLGIDSREMAVTAMGGNSPQTLVNATAIDIAVGTIDLAVLTGGEAWRTRMRARREGIKLDWAKAPDDVDTTLLGAELDMTSDDERERGIVMPVQVYPMFETAVRAAAGRSVDDHQRHLGGLYARFSAVAAGNPNAWTRRAMSADEIATVTDRNRIIGWPYTKAMNSNNDVNMAAALVMCSAAAARSRGVSTDRWVFPHSGSDCHEHPFISHRDRYDDTPAVRLGGRAALDAAGVTIDDIGLVDLYSCFPSAVQLGAQSLGLGLDRQLTRTGGLAYAGGPWNNYSMHAIATTVEELRSSPHDWGLVWANGGYATKHSFGVYRGQPPAREFTHHNPQDGVDVLPRRELAGRADAAGFATVEAYTVMHDRDGRPEQTIAACLLADGRRAWGTSGDRELGTAMTDGEWVGSTVELEASGTLRLP